jgi:cobalamin biosynthesis protein CobD/CbiB
MGLWSREATFVSGRLVVRVLVFIQLILPWTLENPHPDFQIVLASIVLGLLFGSFLALRFTSQKSVSVSALGL